ncbi:hypothetical protein GGR56DRAFT_64271 [Xylariaceae sp. FL0804]|nr:hypothetical protein GGR56DRAFT_64271 [Xylariaceae sp. FL0804]
MAYMRLRPSPSYTYVNIPRGLRRTSRQLESASWSPPKGVSGSWWAAGAALRTWNGADSFVSILRCVSEMFCSQTDNLPSSLKSQSDLDISKGLHEVRGQYVAPASFSLIVMTHAWMPLPYRGLYLSPASYNNPQPTPTPTLGLSTACQPSYLPYLFHLTYDVRNALTCSTCLARWSSTRKKCKCAAPSSQRDPPLLLLDLCPPMRCHSRRRRLPSRRPGASSSSLSSFGPV